MIVRVLGVIMCFLLCCAFISNALVGDSTGINVVTVLDRLSALDYNLSDVRWLINEVSNGFNFENYVFWDYNLTGLSGFLVNIGNFFPTVWFYLLNVLSTVVRGFWLLVLDTLSLVTTLLDCSFILFGLA